MEKQSRRGFIKAGFFSTLGMSTFGYLEKLHAYETEHYKGYSALSGQSLCTHHSLLTTKFISRKGERMSDGNKVPARHDGMACFDLPNGNWMLVRNQENLLTLGGIFKADPNAYDRVCGGGTTNIEVDKNLKVIRQYSSLQGTMFNCAGGKTPWGTWLSCEEFVDSSWMPLTKRHGYVFEVSPSIDGVQEAIPLKAMGRFKHEAVAIDDKNQILYMTEDLKDGLFYRFLPTQYPNLGSGKLQALKVVGQDRLSTSSKRWSSGEELDVEWITIDNPDPKDDTVRLEGHRKGAAIFNRGEGVSSLGEDIYFCASAGGHQGYGQVFHYMPTSDTTGKLRLVYAPDHPSKLNNADNIVVNQHGDLLVCEDGGYQGHNRIFGIRPDGKLYWIASNPHSEWTGICLSDDESVMFCNIQGEGVTVCFTGDFKALREQTV